MIEAVSHLLPSRRLETWEQESIEDVLDAALAWKEGALPIEVFIQTGAMVYDRRTGAGEEASPGYTKFMAMMLTPVGDPRRIVLLEALEAAIAHQNRVRFTAQGAVTIEDVVAYGLRL